MHLVKYQLDAALEAFRLSHTETERLALADPADPELQYELAVSRNRIGYVLFVQRNTAGGLAEYQASLAILQRLAETDPGNTVWQRDLMVIHFQFAEFGVEPAAHLAHALEMALYLQAGGRLSPDETYFPDMLKRRIADLGDADE